MAKAVASGTKTRATAITGLLDQSRSLASWLRELTPKEFAQPSVLPGWDVRTLTGHVLLVHLGLERLLTCPTRAKGLAPAEFVLAYRRDVEAITASTEEAAGALPGAQLVDDLVACLVRLTAALADEAVLPATIETPRGPSTVTDFLLTRIVEVIVHADDLSRSLPDRPPAPLLRGALGIASRTLANILAGQHPGRSVEVRIPPYAAVQCGIGDPGPTHTRGTPPNVVETDAATFWRLATGRITWDAAMATGAVHASGLRADLSPVLPLLS